ncbi:hypothetical protein A2U01_0001546 [Trifolium medium]|uniref:Uncharacterized protein n=1 Tax=Trifolium medium TaxID=97028 RepID=A0A392M172_9FABA|nr:hypothetical protein [Trifolium medium]
MLEEVDVIHQMLDGVDGIQQKCDKVDGLRQIIDEIEHMLDEDMSLIMILINSVRCLRPLKVQSSNES